LHVPFEYKKLLHIPYPHCAYVAIEQLNDEEVEIMIKR